eukprot:TRINITY_DN22827_c0_g1_i1.p1 TRINITY_DN22827_c0_g1~~TRINITY_DN22827_c0_g1_i1.p1  ORF type:complete len:745 (-),score=70.15 TRINITY_DN22827_c0_g1_i1:220-2454(-)
MLMSSSVTAQLAGGLVVSRTNRRSRALIAFPAAVVVSVCLRILWRWWVAYRARVQKCFLCLSSPLEGSAVKLAVPRLRRLCWWQLSNGLVDAWRGACPCCKRPLEARLSEPWSARRPAAHARGMYAYVITLWGCSADYVLGALVLGQSIRKTGSKNSLICLHTDDVPSHFVVLLSKLWDCRFVEHVSACVDKLSYQDGQPHRFDKVFTKLRVLELTEFAKVLLLDIDLAVLQNIDSLFDLSPPAALRRGMNDLRWPLKTGDPIDGRSFFLGQDSSKWSWGQGTGINAGVMLLQPDQRVFDDMLAEISDSNHPSHVRGNGPEQDYLSRYWSDVPWTHIGVEYNYQLHQMFFALHPKWSRTSDRATMLKCPDQIKVVHFSGVPEAKPWHRILDGKFASFWPHRNRDAEYTRLFADEFMGHWLWIKRDRATWEEMPNRHSRSEMQDLYLADDGEIYQRPYAEGDDPKLIETPRDVADGAMRFLATALGRWFDCYEELETSLGIDLRKTLGQHTADGSLVVSTPLPQSITPRKQFSMKNGSDERHGDRVVRERSKPLHWKRQGGWWTELTADAEWEKCAVACSGIEGGEFVSFYEGGVETFVERNVPDLSGVFVKVVGNFSGRHFALHSDPELLEGVLNAIGFWVQGVPAGCGILVAIIGLDMEIVRSVLEALAPLGSPQDVPSSIPRMRALAAAGVRPDPNDTRRGSGWFGEKRGNASSKRNDFGDIWSSCHASSDIAYAAVSTKAF